MWILTKNGSFYASTSAPVHPPPHSAPQRDGIIEGAPHEQVVLGQDVLGHDAPRLTDAGMGRSEAQAALLVGPQQHFIVYTSTSPDAINGSEPVQLTFTLQNARLYSFWAE